MTTLEMTRRKTVWGAMKQYSEWSYVLVSLMIAGACFGVILTRDAPAPEAWLTVGAIVGHWFGRSGNGAANGAGNGDGG